LVYHDWHPLPKNPPALLHSNFLCLFPQPWFSSQPLFLCVCRRQKQTRMGKLLTHSGVTMMTWMSISGTTYSFAGFPRMFWK
jgi:hypothetical protein